MTEAQGFGARIRLDDGRGVWAGCWGMHEELSRDRGVLCDRGSEEFLQKQPVCLFPAGFGKQQ